MDLQIFLQEQIYQFRSFVSRRVEREMAAVEDVDLGFRNVASLAQVKTYSISKIAESAV